MTQLYVWINGLEEGALIASTSSSVKTLSESSMSLEAHHQEILRSFQLNVSSRQELPHSTFRSILYIGCTALAQSNAHQETF